MDKKYFVIDKIILSRTNLILSWTKNILSRQMDRAFDFISLHFYITGTLVESQSLCILRPKGEASLNGILSAKAPLESSVDPDFPWQFSTMYSKLLEELAIYYYTLTE